MDPHSSSAAWQATLQRARAGCSRALGELFDRCRPVLLEWASRALGNRFRAKHGPSDLVQQSFLEAQRDFNAFQGASDQELLAWLRQILTHNLMDFARKYQPTTKRALDRESAEEDAVLNSVVAQDPSPSQHASTREQVLLLQEALLGLDEEKRLALRLRHQEQLSFIEIGRRLGKSEEAARKIWARAVEELRRVIKGGGSGSGQG